MKAKELACNYKHEYITPEHILLVMCDVSVFCEAFEAYNGDIQVLKTNLEGYLEENLEKKEDIEPIESFSLQQVYIRASEQVINSGKEQIELDHLLSGIMGLPESYGVYYILEQGVTLRDLLFELCHAQDDDSTQLEKPSDEEEEQEEQLLQKKRI